MKAFKRAVRTYLQSAIGIFLGLWALSGIAADDFGGVADLTIIAKLAAGSLMGAVPALLSYLQNLLEDHEVIPLLLKEPEKGSAQAVLVLGVLAVLFGLFVMLTGHFILGVLIVLGGGLALAATQ